MKDLRTEPAQTMSYNAVDGEYINTMIEDRVDIYATVEMDVSETDYAFIAGSTKIKVGTKLPSQKGRKLAVPPLFPPRNGRTLYRSVTGPPVFAYCQFSKTTPKLPSTSFLSKGLSANDPFSLRNPDVYSSFSLSFTVFILFLYHQILFNFTDFVKPFLCICSCIHTQKGLRRTLRKP